MVPAYYKEAVSRTQHRRKKPNRAWFQKKEIGILANRGGYNMQGRDQRGGEILSRSAEGSL